jgi:hypothetical protein
MAITNDLYPPVAQQDNLSSLVSSLPAAPTASRQDAVAGFMNNLSPAPVGEPAPNVPPAGLFGPSQSVLSPPPPPSRSLEGFSGNRTRSVF